MPVDNNMADQSQAAIISIVITGFVPKLYITIKSIMLSVFY